MEETNGIDNNPCGTYTERKSISTEHGSGYHRHSKMKSVLVGMVEKLAFQLRSEEWLTSTVVIKIRYANFDTETKTMQSGLYLSRSYPDKNVTDLFINCTSAGCDSADSFQRTRAEAPTK
jgi:DNA polymerase-4